MIRINLALKKQASYIGGKNASGAAGGLSAMGASASSAVNALLGKVIIPIALCAGGYFGFDYYVQQQTAEMEQEVANQTKEKTRIQAELTRIKGFELVRDELERNERILRSKIETIEKLLQGRDNALKSMVTLSQALPKEVWLLELTSDDTSMNIKGAASDIAYVSDVMSRLGQSIYFKDITLKSSSTDTVGKNASFELSARRN